MVERALRMCEVAGSIPAFSIAKNFNNSNYLFRISNIFIIGIFYFFCKLTTLLNTALRKFKFHVLKYLFDNLLHNQRGISSDGRARA